MLGRFKSAEDPFNTASFIKGPPNTHICAFHTGVPPPPRGGHKYTMIIITFVRGHENNLFGQINWFQAKNRSFMSFCKDQRAIPTRRLWQDRRYNRPATADYSADYRAGDPVGMAYVLGDWATDHRPIAVAVRRGDHRLIYQASLIFHCRLVACRRPSPISRSKTEQPSGYGPLQGHLFFVALENWCFST